MYIKKLNGKFLINFDHFDGIFAEKQENGVYRVCLFKFNTQYGFGKLEKSITPIGRYREEQAESILAGIEKSIEDHRMIHVISESEVQNA